MEKKEQEVARYIPKLAGTYLDVTKCAELKFDDQHSDGVVPNSNETDEDIKDRRRTDET